jgi:uncharacterized protein YfkK (UPF0435 family)
MPNRALCNRVVELEEDTDMSGEYEENLECEQTPSVEGRSVVINLSQGEVLLEQSVEVSVNEQARTEVSPVNPSAVPSSVQDMLVTMLASLKSDQQEMIATLKESFKEDISAFQIQIKEDIRLENQKLIERFERENQKLRQELRETLSSEFDAKLGEQAKETNRITDGLAGEIVLNRERIEEQIAELSERVNLVRSEFVKDGENFQNGQGERLEHLLQMVQKEKSVNKQNFDQLKSAISNLKGKIPVSPIVAGEMAASQPSGSGIVPNTLTLNASEGTDGNNENDCVLCSCNLVSCNVCTNEGVNDQNVPTPVRPCNARSYLSATDFALPIFDDSTKVNAMFHLNQLDEFMSLKGVPKQLQLAIAYKSIVDPVGKQWLAAISHSIINYDQFKIAFAKNYWSRAHQNLVKCSIYQDKYDRQSSLSMSSHFIKYAVLASYLEPKLGDGELIDAIRSHFPIYVQRAMLGANITDIQQAIDFLKRLEMMEGTDISGKPNSSPTDLNPMTNKGHPHGQRSERYRPNQQFVRQVNYDRRSNYRQNNYNRGRGRYGGSHSFENRRQSSDNHSPTRMTLNPAAPDFEASSRQISDNVQSEPVSQHLSGNSH